jgi:hypothetical protein
VEAMIVFQVTAQRKRRDRQRTHSFSPFRSSGSGSAGEYRFSMSGWMEGA